MENRPINRRQVLQTLAAGGITAAVLARPGATEAAAVKYPRIRAAIRELRDARKELDEGAKVFGGHRVKALKAVDEAIVQLQRALDYAK